MAMRKVRGFTIGAIKEKLRAAAPRIARQYSSLWDELVVDELTRIEQNARDRMSEGVFDEMHEYGVSQVRKHGLPANNPAWVPAAAVRVVRNGRKVLLQIKTRARSNVFAGFRDEEGIFHPIRASADYNRKRAGERPKPKRKKR